MGMDIRVDYTNMTVNALGERGFTKEDVASAASEASAAHEKVQANRGKGMQGWMQLMYEQDDIVEDIIATAKKVRENFGVFVVLAIGGSALGPIAVAQALRHLYYNELSDEKRGGPRFYVIDNVDPERFNALLDIIDPAETMFNVITKSGATSETMSQYLIVTDILRKKLGNDFASHIIATTDQKKGNLIKLAKEDGYKTFVIPDGVGGRFSELCPVGLLPAAVLGIDIKLLLKGAARMDERCRSGEIYDNPALMGAVFMKLAIDSGKNISVMMPYADSLKYVADWYCQLWGESLGKAESLSGEKVYAGQTPVKALGVTDQHSQIQLYTEGPFDKVITFIGVEKFRNDIEIAKGCEEFPDVNFLCGKTMGELINTELFATRFAVTKAGRMNYYIALPYVDEFTIGQLLYFFMMQTAYVGGLLNIDTYNQPGVEEGKNATYALMGRKGYEKKKEELDGAPLPEESFVI